MTTIAWDGLALAADTLVTNDGLRIGRSVKILKRGRLLVAVAGCLHPAKAFRDWIINGAKSDPPNMAGLNDADGEGVIIMPDNWIVTFDKWGVDAMSAERCAWGSGRRIALGAMQAGASAAEAVRIAATIDTGTGGDITVLRR